MDFAYHSQKRVFPLSSPSFFTSFSALLWTMKLITLLLVAQAAAVDASEVSSTGKDLKPEGNSTERINHNPTITDISEANQRVRISEEDRQEILSKFDKISSDLEDLSTKFSSNIDGHSDGKSNRAIRSLPLDESSICEVEQTTLINFRNELQVTLNRVDHTVNDDINCPLNFDSDNCEELIKLVLCAHNHLKNGFIKATANNAMIGDMTILINALSELEEISTKKFDNLKRSLSQKYEYQLGNLKTDMQNMQKALNKVVDGLKEKTIKSCISEITSGRIESALKDFRDLLALENNNECLARIIKEAYKYKNPGYVDNVVKFVYDLPYISKEMLGYKIIYELMRDDEELYNRDVTILDYYIKDAMEKYADRPEHTATLQDLKNNLAKPVEQIIEGWAETARNGNDYEQIKDFANQYPATFRSILPQIIEKSYANSLSNTERILSFIRHLPNIEDDSVAFPSLFEQMKRNNHLDSYQLLMLAYRVKESMEMPNYNNIDEKYTDIFRNLKYSFPSAVRNLIWDGHRCEIKNYSWNQYLYAASEYFAFNSDRRRIFTWRPGTAVIQGDWNFEPHDNARLFKIKNDHYDEYLYVANADHDYDHLCRRVFTWRPKNIVNTGYWRLEPTDNGQYFRLVNDHYDDPLYVPGNAYDSERFKVFAWKVDVLWETVVHQSKWSIIC
ncbi:uncharacterized protein LOC132260157 [Phlebotomus argentipes]|uniref:uncharacterized protein LOC132260157 n=1 Tax=Phlebotomus argentipes TaxID=94469 RepID=UPI002893693C|nr:uncharacterized protein LOC132260157 [Phlebotomus argentipes]XP_059614094.1 uncharacterized protein LOC132260157 [Phlebotomus argentipes]